MTKVNTPLVTMQDVRELATVLRRTRYWHQREQIAYPIHPLISDALGVARPKDWHQLVLEWPHRSVDQHDDIAYTRDEAKGRTDVQTRVGAGKYLTRHWPDIPPHVVRDLVAAHIVKMEGCCMFLDATTAEIVRSVQQGPVSCMQWGEDDPASEYEFTQGHHPYEVYAPELGWRAAVRTNSKGQFIGRALVHDGTHMRYRGDRNKPVYVRSYKCASDTFGTTEYSHADEKLEAWLQQQGVRKAQGWPEGTPLKHISIKNHGPLLPYIDGSHQHVTEPHGGVLYTMDDNAEDGYCCDGTGGTGSSIDGEQDERSTCDCCGDATDDDDLCYIENEEQSVCPHCLRRHYTRTTAHDWVRDEHVAQTLCGEVTWDDREYAPNNVRHIEAGRYAGDYAIEDDTVYALDEHFWHVDDIGISEECIVQLCDDSHYAGDYAPVEDCMEVDGEWFHKDDVEHHILVEITRGSMAGELALNGDGVTVVLGDAESAGVWSATDQWEELQPCMVVLTTLQPVERNAYFVYLHDASEFAGEAVDIVDAVLVTDVGWFMRMDEAAGNIVRIMDDVYALASDLVAA